MGSPPVVNASPLIFLAQASLFSLLPLLGEEVLVSEAVATEIRVRGSTDVTAQAIENTPWLKIVEAPPVPSMIQGWDLGPGESAVLAWAWAHPGTEAILDDLAARRCAATMDIPVRGTLGLVLVAKQRREISAARPVIEQLRQTGMYLSDSVVRRALALVGE